MESIYLRIRAALGPDRTLPPGFSIQPDGPNGLRFVDGAQDGIAYYHLGAGVDEELLERLESVTSMVSCGGSYDMAEAKLSACFGKRDGMLGCVDALQTWIIEHRDILDAGRLFTFASRLLTGSASLGAVKYALAVLELMSGTQERWRETVRTLALSDEFTLYCVFVASRWQDKNEALFDMARKVRGWGRVHAVRELEPITREMRDWLLDEGWNNEIMAEYTARKCVQQGGLEERLKGPVTPEQLESANSLLEAMMNKGGPMSGGLGGGHDGLALAWLGHIESAALDERLLNMIQAVRDAAVSYEGEVDFDDEARERSEHLWSLVRERADRLLDTYHQTT